MHKILPLCLVLVVMTACNTLTGGAETPAQRYFALKADYQQLLTVAVSYKQNCDAKIDKDGCDTHVEKVQEIDNRIATAFETADAFRLQDETENLDATLIGIGASLQALSHYLLELEDN